MLRNDLLHALPVLHGLHRRTRANRGRVVNFYTTAQVRLVRLEFERVRTLGRHLLYFDGGAAVTAWSRLP